MTMRGTRLYKQGIEWKIGQIKPFFISFVHVSNTGHILKGRSDLLEIYLFEGNLMPVPKIAKTEEIKIKFEDTLFELKIWHIITVLLSLLCIVGMLAWVCRKTRRKPKVHMEIMSTD